MNLLKKIDAYKIHKCIPTIDPLRFEENNSQLGDRSFVSELRLQSASISSECEYACMLLACRQTTTIDHRSQDGTLGIGRNRHTQPTQALFSSNVVAYNSGFFA
jgi:hypothetical protein